jgi:hypothetical protein
MLRSFLACVARNDQYPFVYGDGDGHLEMLPKHMGSLGFHPPTA